MNPRQFRCDPRPNARDIIEDFIHRVEAVIALQNDGRRGMAREHAVQKVERFGRYWMRMGISKKWLWQASVGHGDSARHVDLAHKPGRKIVKKGDSVEAVVGGVEIEVLDIEQE